MREIVYSLLGMFTAFITGLSLAAGGDVSTGTAVLLVLGFPLMGAIAGLVIADREGAHRVKMLVAGI